MTIVDLAREYFDAWNGRDPARVAGMFADGGSYADPASGVELKGAAIAEYAEATFATFPDLSFDATNIASTSDKTVAVEWIMRGTNQGPFAGNPPTGREVNLPGADFIDVQDDRIRSVRGYFDRQQLAEQLGLQVIVEPVALGSLEFGVGMHRPSGKATKPGAISLIWIEGRTLEEKEFIASNYANHIVEEMAELPGFLGMKSAIIGPRMSSALAWEEPENTNGLFAEGSTHKAAYGQFLNGDVGFALHTSVWIPHHINALWVRCAVCHQVADYYESSGKCPRGHDLPDPPPYW